MAHDTRHTTRIPSLDASDEEIRAFRRRYFNTEGGYRTSQLQRVARNLLYFYGRQWIEPHSEVMADGSRGYIFRDKAQFDDLPRPVTNYLANAVGVEQSSLTKRELEPAPVSSSRDPRIEAAIRVAKDVLRYRLSQLDWADKRDEFTFLNVVGGVSVLKSYWDETYSEVTQVGCPTAVYCLNCNGALASPEIEPENIAAVKANTQTIKMVDGKPSLSHCPQCDGLPLMPFDVPSPDFPPDMFGRPMTTVAPKGNTGLDVLSLFDVFPINSGIGESPYEIKTMGQCSVRSLDWIEERYPEAMDRIQPEDPYELMRYHPTLGDWSLLGRFQSSLDSNLYDYHARVYEVHSDPSYRFPMGRSIVMVGDEVVTNGPLIRAVEVTDMKGDLRQLAVPLVKYFASGSIPKHKEFWHKSLVDDLVSPQNRLNGIDALDWDTFERVAAPNLLLREGMELSGPSYNEAMGGAKFLTYTPDPIDPSAKPEELGGRSLPSDVTAKRQAVIEDMRSLGVATKLEEGEAPRNITTTSGLQLLGESADKKRAARERSIINAFEKAWTHQMQLMWVLGEDDYEYEAQGSDGEWETRQYNRWVFDGITKVKVEKQAHVDKGLYIREAIREAQADQLYRLDSQLAIKKILEYRGLPTDVNQNLNRQVDLGTRQYTDYLERRIVPAIDTTMDDPLIRFETIGTLLMEDDGKELEASVNWPVILKKIAGWEDELARAEAADAIAVAFYGGRPSQEEAQPIYEQALAQHAQGQQQALTAYQAMPPGTPPPTPAPPPPPPVFLPAALEDRILMVWKKLIQANGGLAEIMPPPGTGMDGALLMDPIAKKASEVDLFLQFRSVLDAYRLMAQRKQAAMMAPVPAPGTPASNPGLGGATPGLTTPTTQVTNPPNPPNAPLS